MGIISDIYTSYKRQNALQGLLGDKVTTEGSMQGADIEYDEEGNPIYTNMTKAVEVPRSQYSGFLGSNNQAGDIAAANAGLLTSGFNPSEAASILSPFQKQAADNRTSLMKNMAAAGVDFNTPEGQELMKQVILKPQTQINNVMGGGLAGQIVPDDVKKAHNLSPDAVYQYGKDNMIKKVSGAKYTPVQNKAAGFALRMDQANKEMDEIEANLDFDPASLKQNLGDFGVPDVASNILRSPEEQRYEQAKQNWGSANLRDESGAVLSKDEMEKELRKYFAVFGDKQEVIEQKRRARNDLIRTQIKNSGGAYQELKDAKNRERLKELRGKFNATN